MKEGYGGRDEIEVFCGYKNVGGIYYRYNISSENRFL